MHPDLLELDDHFYPFKYLLVIEPYPYGNDRFENPSLLGSHDGIWWNVPPGVINPIVSAPVENGAWCSDADLFNYRGERLFLYYRYNSGRGETTLFRKTTARPGGWTEPEAVFTVPVSGRFASPATALLGGQCYMLYVDTMDSCVRALKSPDGETWSDDRFVLAFPGAWHVDAVARNDGVYVLLTDKESLFLLRSGDLETWWIFDGAGEGAEGGEWKPYSWRPGAEMWWRPVLATSKGGWDDGRIYRSTFLIEGNVMRLWYGAQGSNNEWRIGYTDGFVAR